MDTVSAPNEDRCVIEGCSRTRGDHSPYLNGTGHVFTSASQRRSSIPFDPFKRIRKMTEEERNRTSERQFAPAGIAPKKRDRMMVPPERPRLNDQRPCVHCRKPRRSHRGKRDHIYTPVLIDMADFTREPGEAAPSREQKPKPRVLTNAMITEAVERALRSISIGPRLTIKKIEIEPHVAVDSDEMLTADVAVKFGLIF